MNTEKLTQALTELADAPQPDGLADQALRGARVRRRGFVIGATAACALVLAVPVAASVVLDRRGAELQPGVKQTGLAGAVNEQDGDCVSLPNAKDGVKQVAEKDWPQFVRLAMAKLPKRSDYVVESVHDVCTPGVPETPNAYAVISLGTVREYGYLTLNLHRKLVDPPKSCADLTAEKIWCTDGKVLVFAIRVSGWINVVAVYEDGRSVWLETHVGDTVPEEYKTVVTDPGLAALVQ